MFNRRKKLNIGQRVIGFFWPSMGWRRTGHYIKHRICRIPGSPYEIAGGFACGAAISFSPFVGLHFILGGIWAWLIRSNISSSIIGTAVGNPWTFPFIWAWIYQCGLWMGVGNGNSPEGVIKLNFANFFARVSEAILSGDLNFLFNTAGPVFWPMLIGCLPTVAIAWIVFYFPIKALVENYQKNRIQARARKAQERLNSLTTHDKEKMS